MCGVMRVRCPQQCPEVVHMIEVEQVKMSAVQCKQAAAASTGAGGGMGEPCTLQVIQKVAHARVTATRTDATEP